MTVNPREPGGGSGAVRRRFVVSGRVQGVGFRYWTVRQADSLGLRGIVRNLTDGSVEVEVEGAPDSVERLREVLERGPAYALVRELRELPPAGRELPTGFEVTF